MSENQTISAVPKISWRTDLTKDWSETFYPSLAKKIQTSDNYFKETYELIHNSATVENITSTFFPLYEQFVANKPDYLLEVTAVKQAILAKIQSKTYYLSTIRLKKDNTPTGVILYNFDNSLAKIAYRAFNRDINMQYKHRTTVDFWAEKELYLHFQSQNIQELSHGQDSHPFINRAGLALFKLSAASKPKLIEKYADTIDYTYTDISNLTPDQGVTLNFSEPNNARFFTQADLFFRVKNPPSVALSISKVLEFHNIHTIYHDTAPPA